MHHVVDIGTDMETCAAVEVNKAIQYVYEELGPHMNERAYSRALQVELQCRNFLVDSERQVNIWYTTSTGQLHLVAPDRCDLFVRPDGQSPIVIELKVRKANPSDKAQLRRYMIGFKKELSKEVVGVLVYFLATGAHIEWVDE